MKANPQNNGKLHWYGAALMFVALIVAVVVTAVALTIGAVIAAVVVTAVIRSSAEEPTVTVSRVEDYNPVVSMGHILLNEWDVAAMGMILSDEVKAGSSVLEVHNDGEKVHRLAIWRGGGVEEDHVVGVTLIAETGDIQPGGVETLDVDLEPGEYALICSVPGHLARGMHAKVQVQ